MAKSIFDHSGPHPCAVCDRKPPASAPFTSPTPLAKGEPIPEPAGPRPDGIVQKPNQINEGEKYEHTSSSE